MTIALRVRAVPHLFMPGQTVSAVLKLYNLQDVMPGELKELLAQFKSINGDKNFKAGEKGMIPILVRHQQEVFKKK